MGRPHKYLRGRPVGGERDANPGEGRPEKQKHRALARVTSRPGFAWDGPVSSEGGNFGAMTEKVPGELTEVPRPSPW